MDAPVEEMGAAGVDEVRETVGAATTWDGEQANLAWSIIRPSARDFRGNAFRWPQPDWID